ncbi:hypothetical protein ACFE04_020800 [Oxalis oulophora]
MTDDNGIKKLHIAMFPWLAFGHMIPWLELAKLIARKGHKISFINTPRNIHRLPKLPSNLSPLVSFITVPLPNVPNLPPTAESTSDLSFDDVWHLKESYDLLPLPITQLLQSLSPDWLFYDVTASWLPAIARDLNIPHGCFSIFNAATLGFLGPPSVMMHGCEDFQKPEGFTVKPKWIPFDTTVSFRLFEARKLSRSLSIGQQDHLSDMERFGKVFDECEIVAIRSCTEFEPEWITLLEKLYRKPVIPVGELPSKVDDVEYDADMWQWIKDWLDKQSEHTVVYVAFGSEAKPSQAEINEIAYGLNAKLLEEKKIGYLVPRNEEDGRFDRDSVAESLRLVMVDKEGNVYREKAKEMKGLFGNRDMQEHYVDNFLEYLQEHIAAKPS